ncbi:hypothetical protein F2Q70_00039584 [Brassica cretica]|uniref:Uncharacterized protein n=1 Tax=Brassica cretica TaxID=69181 RepID=A0A8S9K5S3_BRACR|nr:hypothetical protein F2Q70_00039584 [Brassica cretica]
MKANKALGPYLNDGIAPKQDSTSGKVKIRIGIRVAKDETAAVEKSINCNALFFFSKRERTHTHTHNFDKSFPSSRSVKATASILKGPSWPVYCWASIWPAIKILRNTGHE